MAWFPRALILPLHTCGGLTGAAALLDKLGLAETHEVWENSHNGIASDFRKPVSRSVRWFTKVLK